MTPEELYSLYAAWTGQLHTWVLTQLGRHVDAEFFPAPDWKFKIYSGSAAPIGTRFAFIEGEAVPVSTVPNLIRPPEEASFTLKLPTPADNPTAAQLEQTFRNLCLATAKLLEIELHAPKLKGSAPKPRAPHEPGRSTPLRRTLRPPKGRKRPADEDR